MFELLIILIFAAVALSIPWINGWSPEVLLWVVTVIIAGIGIAKTIISCHQARRRNPRFVDGYLLGVIEIAIGFILLAIFLSTLGSRAETFIMAAPYLMGGLLILLPRILPAKTEAVKKESTVTIA